MRREIAFRRGGFHPKLHRFADSVYTGSLYGGWAVRQRPLGADSIVYSFGVGQDISFDLAVIQQFGCSVQAFDPTPVCQSWVREQTFPEQFRFHPTGLASTDGSIELFEPRAPGAASFSKEAMTADARSVEVPVKRLSTILGELRHERLDVLKMDIEGCEYEVIDDLIATDLRPKQVLVEFHHRIHRRGLEPTKRAYDQLTNAGYRLFAISDLGDEYSFSHASID